MSETNADCHETANQLPASGGRSAPPCSPFSDSSSSGQESLSDLEDLKRLESSAQDSEELVSRWTFVGPESESWLQCSCGKKHRLRYSRTDIGQHLDLLPSSSLTYKEGSTPIRAIRPEELRSILFGEESCGISLENSIGSPSGISRKEFRAGGLPGGCFVISCCLSMGFFAEARSGRRQECFAWLKYPEA